ncbi:MAG: hypothetical protein WBK20_10655 [Spirochaetota bacterium]
MHKILIIIIAVLTLLQACSIIYEDLEEYIEYKYLLKWDPSPEAEVNSPGGGYVIYYAQGNTVDINKSCYVDVPYNGGSITPCEKILSIKIKKNTDTNTGTKTYTFSAVVVSYATFYGIKVYSNPSNKITFTIQL